MNYFYKESRFFFLFSFFFFWGGGGGGSGALEGVKFFNKETKT